MKQLSKLKLNEFVEMNDKELRFIVGGSGTSGSSGADASGASGCQAKIDACKNKNTGDSCSYVWCGETTTHNGECKKIPFGPVACSANK
ncbi:hypothetical protein FACS1894123_06530 [Bacteroidia bacterium]|nr:hypothetical protein FACS1894123_06530 [Bacteroidia bacterium]